MRAPEFWSEPRSPLGALLAPAGALYAWGGQVRRACTSPMRAPVPVVCIGNLTLGGAGKTPVALAVAHALAQKGHKPAFLTRGYGGHQAGPLVVAPGCTARDVGDEPLLLAHAFPTIVARDRPAGVALAVRTGAEVIVMDDGFQNPTLTKDLSLVVIDSETGFGNGRVFPAGPLREPVAAGLDRAHAVVLTGAGPLPALPLSCPVLRTRLVVEWPPLARTMLAAFAGIGRPEKFFATLRAHDAELVLAQPFPDHHPYTDEEIMLLRDRAGGARLITTEKDFVRLSPAQRQGILTLPVRAAFDDTAALGDLLDRAIASAPAAAGRDQGAHRTS